jgi:hypothetical protein
MRSLIAKFARILLWCWVPVTLAVFALIMLLGLRGEPVQWGSSSTWLAFADSVAVAGLCAVPPAFILAVLFSVVAFRGSVRASDSVCSSLFSRREASKGKNEL